MKRPIMRHLTQVIVMILATASALAKAPSDAETPFSEMKIVDQSGRPWREAKEDWQAARVRVEESPKWRRWLLKERAEVDTWMQGTRDRPEWTAGWSHDGVSPKDGSPLIWTEDIPGKKAKFLSSETDSRVEITPKIFAWWVVTFRARNADMMVRAARLYWLTDDRRYAEWASGQLDFYANNYLGWKPRKGEARIFGQPVTEATNLIKFAETARLLEGYVGAETKQAWWEKLFDPEVKMLAEGYQDINNIACWQRSAAAQIALLYGREDLWQAAIDGPFGIRQQAREGITGDFLWREQSFSYNDYAIEAFLSLFETAGLYGRAPELAVEMTRVENMMLAPIYLRFPDGTLPNPSDSIGVRKGVNVRLLADAYRVFPTGLGLGVAAKRLDWDALLDPPEPPPKKMDLPEVKSTDLEDMRMALLRGGNWQVFFQYGQIAKTHAQAEALNYVAFYGKTDVTHDTGTVKYGSPAHKNYFTRGLNHNVPLINGEGAEPPQPGELVKFSADPPLVTASQPNFRHDGSASRTIEIQDDKLIVATTVQSHEPAKLGMALHFQGKVHLPDSFRANESFSENRPKSFGYWNDVKKAAFDKEAAFRVSYGDLEMRVTITADQAFTLWHAETPDRPPLQRESLYLEVSGTNATFTTTWESLPPR